MARRRGLTPEERELWARVARSAKPLAPRTDPVRAPDASVRSQVRQADPPPELPISKVISRFRLGQAAPQRGSGHGAMPGPAERLGSAPLRMDHKTHKRMSSGKLRPEARLDLHGLTLAAAHPELIRFILACHAGGKRLVLVITGKGRGDHGPLPTRPGALRHQVPHWLHGPPLSALVQQVTPAHYRHGGEGAYYVYLRRSPA
ncbi:Smr/MutS family protein [Paracoccus salsus]|uniref:Smr/MutS family protein n=1 Tax=Paracoccus salsus TaxID=2911061 RepID=UPI001F213DB6|nr:Smr/MutS family protein [Paracoccus salsus]MCF3974388.1 Smr/MutS family protein [Paracoccus salsus]